MKKVLRSNKARRKKVTRGGSLCDPRMANRLSQEEVDKLFAAFAKGDKESGHTLILSVLPLCINQVRTHNPQLFFRVGFDDVMHELFIHLLGHLPTYDHSRGKITTWAYWRTLDLYDKKLRAMVQIVRIPRNYLRKNPVGKAVFSGYEWDDYPELLYSDEPEPLKRLMDESEPIEQWENEEMVEILLSAAMTPRERKIIKLRLKGETLAAAGKTVGVCKERVRQILDRAYKKAKRYYDRLSK